MEPACIWCRLLIPGGARSQPAQLCSPWHMVPCSGSLFQNFAWRGGERKEQANQPYHSTVSIANCVCWCWGIESPLLLRVVTNRCSRSPNDKTRWFGRSEALDLLLLIQFLNWALILINRLSAASGIRFIKLSYWLFFYKKKKKSIRGCLLGLNEQKYARPLQVGKVREKKISADSPAAVSLGWL